MNKKPHKVEEPATPYPAKPPVKAETPAKREKTVRYVDAAKARALTDKILDKHSDLFRRLAQ